MSTSSRHGAVAQLAEQLSCKELVAGSTPVSASSVVNTRGAALQLHDHTLPVAEDGSCPASREAYQGGNSSGGGSDLRKGRTGRSTPRDSLVAVPEAQRPLAGGVPAEPATFSNVFYLFPKREATFPRPKGDPFTPLSVVLSQNDRRLALGNRIESLVQCSYDAFCGYLQQRALRGWEALTYRRRSNGWVGGNLDEMFSHQAVKGQAVRRAMERLHRVGLVGRVHRERRMGVRGTRYWHSSWVVCGLVVGGVVVLPKSVAEALMEEGAGRGGRRTGSGRPKGSKNRATLAAVDPEELRIREIEAEYKREQKARVAALRASKIESSKYQKGGTSISKRGLQEVVDKNTLLEESTYVDSSRCAPGGHITSKDLTPAGRAAFDAVIASLQDNPAETSDRPKFVARVSVGVAVPGVPQRPRFTWAKTPHPKAIDATTPGPAQGAFLHRLLRGAWRARFKRVPGRLAPVTGRLDVKLRTLLTNAVTVMVEHGVPPAAWIAFRLDQWRHMHPDKGAPPLEFVLGGVAKGLDQFWHTHYVDNMGGLGAMGTESRNVYGRWEAMAFEVDANPTQDPSAIVREHFPEGFAIAVRNAQLAEDRRQRELNELAYSGEWVWL